MSRFRLPGGGRIDRSKRLRFRFDGRAYEGVAGDTLASALIANGVHLVGRSFKYHRPRGIVAAGAEEPNALVAVVRAAAASGAQVMLCDEQAEFGGSLLAASDALIDRKPAQVWLAETVTA